MRREDTPTTEPIFPAPPYSPKDVDIRLMREVTIQAGRFNWRETGHDKVTDLGGFGGAFNQGPEQPQVEILDNVWVPANGEDKSEDEKQRGSWKQEVIFRSTVTFKCPPSFSTKTMTVGVSRVNACRCIRLTPF